MPTPAEIEQNMADAPDKLPPGPWRVGTLPPAQWRCIVDANSNVIATVAEWNDAGLLELEFGGAAQARAVAAAIAAIPEREREIERLRLLINTDITELHDERDRLRARVAELEEALDVARICLKNRDRPELEEKAYFGICAVLAAKPTSEA